MGVAAAILIPARLASTRLPEKLLRADTGRPLLTYVIDAAERARRASRGAIQEIVVAADCAPLRDAATAHAAAEGIPLRAVLTRPDHASGSDRIAEAAAALPSEISLFVNIQGDEPELPPEAILRILSLLEEHPEAQMSTLARPIRDPAEFENPSAVKVVLDRMGRCLYFSRAPIPHDRDHTRAVDDPLGLLHLGLYGYRRASLLGYASLPPSRLEQLERLEQLRALESGWTIVADTIEYGGAGIDTEADYQDFVRRIRAAERKA